MCIRDRAATGRAPAPDPGLWFCGSVMMAREHSTPHSAAPATTWRSGIRQAAPSRLAKRGVVSVSYTHLDVYKRQPQVRFRFECPNNWNTLEPTDQADRRFCPSCGEHVYFAESVSRAEQLARQGACIAVPAQLTDKLAKNLTEHCVGRPDWRKMWAERIFGEDRDCLLYTSRCV